MSLKKIAQKAYIHLAPTYSDLEEVQILNIFKELNQERLIKFGIPEIDKLVSKNTNRGSIVSIMSETAQGLSSTLISLACNALKNDKDSLNSQKIRILYLYFDGASKIVDRFIGSLASVDSLQLEDLINKNKSILDIATEYDDQIVTESLGLNEDLSSETFLTRYLGFYEKYPFDVLILDDPYFISKDKNIYSFDRHSESQAIQELTHKLNCLTIVGTRGSEHKGPKHSLGLAMRSNMILELSRKNNTELIFKVLKHRFLDKVNFNLDIDFSKPQLPYEKSDSETILIQNQTLIYSTKKELEKIGIKVKMTELYELFSKLSGDKSWNVAKAKNTSFFSIFETQTTLPKEKFQLKSYCEYLIKKAQ